MIENLNFLIPLTFSITVLLTFLFLYTAIRRHKAVFLIGVLLWLSIHGMLANSGFYLNINVVPQKLILIFPPLIILILFLFIKGKHFIDTLSLKILTWLHIVRIPVELVLYGLFIHGQIPELMTFEGRNLDILSGLSAPFVAYYGFSKRKLSNGVLLAWNFICLGLLLNIVVNAILSAPLPIQQFAFDQPNVAVFYFPFIWLPGFVVPVVLFSHLVAIRQLLMKKEPHRDIEDR